RSGSKASSGGNSFANRRWLRLARAAWIAAAVLTVWLYLFGVPVFYYQLQTVCTAAPCYASPLPEAVRAWAHAGISIVFVARYKTALIVLTALVNGVVAAAIFWRKSDDPMALFTAFALL